MMVQQTRHTLTINYKLLMQMGEGVTQNDKASDTARLLSMVMHVATR